MKKAIGFEETSKRYYPYNSFASSVIGFTNYDGDGVYGLEAYYNDELKGKNGRIITAKDAKSKQDCFRQLPQQMWHSHSEVYLTLHP